MRRPVCARILRDRLQQRLRAPLHAGRTKLHVDLGTCDGRGDRVRQLDIGFRRHRRADEHLLDRAAIVVGEAGENRLFIAIHDRILVAHRKRKGDADADIGRRARDRVGFLDQRHRAARAGVMDHHRRAAGPRRTRQRGGRGQIGIDRRAERGAQDPAFQRHAERAERGRGRARVVVGVDEGGKHEGARAGRGRRALGDSGDDAVVVPQHDVFEQAAVRAGEQAVCGNFRGHDQPLRHCERAKQSMPLHGARWMLRASPLRMTLRVVARNDGLIRRSQFAV